MQEHLTRYSKITKDLDHWTFPYHFTVWYIPGLNNQLADCLSWYGGGKDTIKLPKLHAYHITNQLCARSDGLQQIRIATQEDDKLALLKHTITQGWPSTIKEHLHGCFSFCLVLFLKLNWVQFYQRTEYFLNWRQTFVSYPTWLPQVCRKYWPSYIMWNAWENIVLHNFSTL